MARDGQVSWLLEALAAPTFHLLLCGSPVDWDGDEVGALRDRFADLVSIHHLTREPAPGVLHDVEGTAFAHLGVGRAAHYLVRPDGHVGHRSAATDLRGLERYLAPLAPRRRSGAIATSLRRGSVADELSSEERDRVVRHAAADVFAFRVVRKELVVVDVRARRAGLGVRIKAA